ncbi:hypothetical protein [uncultured Roseibium sp.]|uniref:hypothetical protein n=1 Tax=uncultured Roseibium sp. TaxID=1936171 RepID=UPI0032176D85
MASRSDLKLLSLLRINQIFIELSPEMNLSQLSAFLVAALHQPTGEDERPPTIRELATLSELPYTSMSRHYRYLGERQRHGKEGLGLVDVRIDPDNKRQKQVYLTSNGSALAKKILTYLK